MKKSDSIAKLSMAMAKFQKDVKQPMKDAANPFFKSHYVPLENVVEAITTAAAPHGLSFTQYPVNGDNGTIGVITMVLHESGEFIEYDAIYSVPKKANDVQQLGSVITYLRRYSLSSIFGITSDNDDDGNAASDANPANKKQNNAPRNNNGHNRSQNQNNAPAQQPPQNQQPPQELDGGRLSAIGNLITDMAMKQNIAPQEVYTKSLQFLNINPETPSKYLMPPQADALINYLEKNGAQK